MYHQPDPAAQMAHSRMYNSAQQYARSQMYNAQQRACPYARPTNNSYRLAPNQRMPNAQEPQQRMVTPAHELQMLLQTRNPSQVRAHQMHMAQQQQQQRPLTPQQQADIMASMAQYRTRMALQQRLPMRGPAPPQPTHYPQHPHPMQLPQQPPMQQPMPTTPSPRPAVAVQRPIRAPTPPRPRTVTPKPMTSPAFVYSPVSEGSPAAAPQFVDLCSPSPAQLPPRTPADDAPHQRMRPPPDSSCGPPSVASSTGPPSVHPPDAAPPSVSSMGPASVNPDFGPMSVRSNVSIEEDGTTFVTASLEDCLSVLAEVDQQQVDVKEESKQKNSCGGVCGPQACNNGVYFEIPVLSFKDELCVQLSGSFNDFLDKDEIYKRDEVVDDIDEQKVKSEDGVKMDTDIDVIIESENTESIADDVKEICDKLDAEAADVTHGKSSVLSQQLETVFSSISKDDILAQLKQLNA